MSSQVQLINTAFITLFAKLVLGSRYSFISGRDIDKLNFFGPSNDLLLKFIIDGLLEGIIFIFISNAVITPVLNFADIGYIKSLFKRKKLLKEQQENKLTQEKANQYIYLSMSKSKEFLKILYLI